MSSISELEKRLTNLKDNLSVKTQEITSLKQALQTQVNDTYKKAYGKLLKDREKVENESYDSLSDNYNQPDFDNDENWEEYKPILKLNANTLPDRLNVGGWINDTEKDKENNNDDSSNFVLNAFIPFFGQQKTIIIDVNNETKDNGVSLMRSIIQRIYTLIPHYAQFTLIDPETNGAAFPMQRDVYVRQNDVDIYHLLENVIADMRRITSISALTEKEYFSTKVESVTMNEKFEFICAANFPNGYDSRSIEKLVNIGNIGYVSGKYLILMYNHDEVLPRDFDMNMFKDPIHINLIEYDEVNTIPAYGHSIDYVQADEAGPEEWKQIVKHISSFKPEERMITWDEYIAVKKDQIWKASSKEVIETNIGDVGGKSLSVWFGKKDGNNCAHGMLAATTGAGKSNFYHALILGLATRYSPEELRMYLIDGKNGVEFEVYRSFPHAEVVSLKSSSELTGSILTELVSEVVRRNDLFKKVGVNGFDEYRRNDSNKMPRILLLIDEYQVLFEGKDAVKASDDLRTLSAQARSAGVHIILGSQRFSVPNIQNKDAIFGNIQLRIAMKMTQDDRLSLTEFGKEGKEFIRACDLPGQIVVNQNSGSDGANQLGKVAYIKAEQKTQIIQDIENLAKELVNDNRIMRTIVFEGDSAPNLDENPELMGILSRKVESAQTIQKIARIEERDGGFGKPEWNMSENPKICWLGQEFNVYGQCSLVLRNRKMENLLILGDRNASRYGMLVSSLVSLVSTTDKNDISFYIYDRSTPGTDWNPYLKKLALEVLSPAGYRTIFSNKVKDIEAGLRELNSELDKRLALDQDDRVDLKPIVLVITEPEDIEALNQTLDSNGFKSDSELGAILTRLAISGSAAGIYVILSSSGVIPIQNVVSKKQFTYFRHRVSLQISEQESFDFLQSRIGSTLQQHGDFPTVAYYADMNGNTKIRFKPYSIKDENFDAQFDNIKSLILAR